MVHPPTLPLSPHHACARCGEARAVAQMALVRRAWVCHECVAARRHLHPPAEPAATSPPAAAPAVAVATLGSLRELYQPAMARAACYGILLLLAPHSAAVMGALTGCLLADLVTWGASLLLAAARDTGPVLADLAVFMVTGAVWTHVGGGLELPPDSAARAATLLAGFTVFGVQTGRFTWRLLHGNGAG